MLWIGAEMLNILGVYSVFIALAYFAMFLHEIGHILAALYFKIEVKKVGFTWKGAYIIRESGPTKINMLIALAGPLMNIIIGLFALKYFLFFAEMNFVLGFGNLLPMKGSDGDRLITLWNQLQKEKYVSPSTT